MKFCAPFLSFLFSFLYCNVNAFVQAVEFAKLCFSNRYQKGNTSLKNNIFIVVCFVE
jgi:hypothetical protein